MDAYRLQRVDMLLCHEPAGFVGAQRQQRDVEAALRLAIGEVALDVAEVLGVAGVSGEEEVLIRREDGPAAPQGVQAVVQAPARPVLGRREHELGAADAMGLPPVQFDHVGDVDRAQPFLEAQRHQKQRRAAGLAVELPQAALVEVVVVVVRDHHRIDARQIRQCHAGGLGALRPHPLHGRCALREDRIGQQVDAAQLRQHGGVADPGHRRLHRTASGRVAAKEGQVRPHRGDRPRRGARQALARALPAPAQQVHQALALELDVVVLEAFGAMVRGHLRGPRLVDVGGLRVGVHQRTGQHQQGQCGNGTVHGANHRSESRRQRPATPHSGRLQVPDSEAWMPGAGFFV